jgi:hypothetical protein
VGVCGSLGGNNGDLGAGRDKNSSVMVACHVEKIWFLGIYPGVWNEGGLFEIFFWFWMAEIDDSRWIGVFGCVEIKGDWGLGIVGIGCDGMSDGVSLWVWAFAWFVGIGGGRVSDRPNARLWVGSGLDGLCGLWTAVIAGFLEKMYRSMFVIPSLSRTVQKAYLVQYMV